MTSEEAIAAGAGEQPLLETEAVEIAAAEEPEAAPAKPRRSRRKPAADKPDADATAADENEAKPKRASRSRRKKVEEEPAAPVALTAVDGGNGPSITIEAAEIVVEAPTPDLVAETVAIEATVPKAPARKGWWNKLTS